MGFFVTLFMIGYIFLYPLLVLYIVTQSTNLNGTPRHRNVIAGTVLLAMWAMVVLLYAKILFPQSCAQDTWMHTQHVVL